jgi:bifunctional non-homologous end joining protein LigD
MDGELRITENSLKIEANAMGAARAWQSRTCKYPRKPAQNAYFCIMFEFCIPTTGTNVPYGPEWLHEITFDGYRLRIGRDGDRVRLITKGGYDWSKRYPWIVEAALKNRQKQFVIDGEAVILGVDGYSDFNALHSGKHNDEVQLLAFDALAMDGDDLRNLPLSMRKANLQRLLSRRLMDFEQGEIGRDLFRKACEFAWKGWGQSGKTGPIAVAVEILDQGEDRRHQAFERVRESFA